MRNMKKILEKKFFERSATAVARELLGKFLVRRIGSKETAVMIIETEAYDGFKDKASHAHRGRTERNKPMFGVAGVWYVYFVYGNHFMLNIVTGKKNYPAAVLIRGAEEIINEQRTSYEHTNRRTLDGPGKLTKFLKIDKKLNDAVASRRAGLWFEDRGVKIEKKNIKRTPRIGVHYAGNWAKKLFRFVLVRKLIRKK